MIGLPDLRQLVLVAIGWWLLPNVFSHSTPTPPPRPSSSRTAPRILRVELSKLDIGAGDHVTGEVVTSPNVKTVKALIVGESINLTRSRVGHFPIFFTVPTPVPFFFKGNQSVEFVALDASGAKATKTINFHVH